MKRFAAKSALFVLLVSVMLLSLSVLCRRIRARGLGDAVFVFGEHVDTLVAGDSHPQASINPAQWPQAVNVCEGGENYFVSYHKIAYFLRRNPGIQHVVLGFSYQNLARSYQEAFVTSEREAVQLLESQFVLLDQRGLERLRSVSRQTRAYYLNLLKFKYGLPIQVYRDKDFLRTALGAPLRREDVGFFGAGFHESDQSRVDARQMDSKARLYFLDESGKYSGVSRLMLEYLRKTIRLCQERGAVVHLYNGPLHPSFKTRIPGQAIADFVNVRDELLGAFPRIRYIDLVDERLPADCYGDGDHVNSKGAKIVTQRVATLVNSTP